MVLQAALGLLRREWYVDEPWVKSTWLGNDLVTLLVVVPLLAMSLDGARRGSARASLAMTGLIGYAAYNYAFYLLGAALNVFFPLYVGLVLLSMWLLARMFPFIAPAPQRHHAASRPRRWVGVVLVFVGAGLAVVWLLMWSRYVFFGAPTPVGVDAFRLVAALDLTIIAPALITSGVLIWRRRPWGDVCGTVAAIGGTAYLIVLAVNAAIAWSTSRVAAPGELLLWGTLAVLMAGSALTLWRSAPLPRRAS